MIDIDQDKSKLYQYHQHHPWALRRTSAPVDDSLQEVKDEEGSIGEKVNVDIQTEKQESTTMKKASVALAGGSMIAVGIPLVPTPIPGCLVIAGGLSILAREFPAAQKFLDKGIQRLQLFANGSRNLDNNRKGDYYSDGIGYTSKGTGSNNRSISCLIRNFTKNKILPLIQKD